MRLTKTVDSDFATHVFLSVIPTKTRHHYQKGRQHLIGVCTTRDVRVHISCYASAQQLLGGQRINISQRHNLISTTTSIVSFKDFHCMFQPLPTYLSTAIDISFTFYHYISAQLSLYFRPNIRYYQKKCLPLWLHTILTK